MTEYKARIEPKGRIHAVILHFTAANIVDAVNEVKDICAPHGWCDEDIKCVIENPSALPKV